MHIICCFIWYGCNNKLSEIELWKYITEPKISCCTFSTLHKLSLGSFEDSYANRFFKALYIILCQKENNLQGIQSVIHDYVGRNLVSQTLLIIISFYFYFNRLKWIPRVKSSVWNIRRVMRSISLLNSKTRLTKWLLMYVGGTIQTRIILHMLSIELCW